MQEERKRAAGEERKAEEERESLCQDPDPKKRRSRQTATYTHIARMQES